MSIAATLGQEIAEDFVNETRGYLQKMADACKETVLKVIKKKVIKPGKSSGKANEEMCRRKSV